MNLKCLPYNHKSTVAIGSVAGVAIAPANRAQKPYPPGSVKVNGTSWPGGATLHGDVTLTWAHRSRVAQAGLAIVQQDAASTVAAPEGSYTVEALVDGVLKRTQAGITGTSYTYTLAQRTADNADLSKQVQFRITPVLGALSGTVRSTDAFVMQP